MGVRNILEMSNEEAAAILKKCILGYHPGRGNGKSETELRMIMALHKAIYALEKESKGENSNVKANHVYR